jgi:hypothetical protein
LCAIRFEQKTTPVTVIAANPETAGQADQSSSSSSSSDTSTVAAAVQQSSPEALQAFLVEQGLSQPQASQLLKALTSDAKFAACLNTQRLAQKLASLERALPDVQPVQLLLTEPELLLASRWVSALHVRQKGRDSIAACGSIHHLR